MQNNTGIIIRQKRKESGFTLNALALQVFQLKVLSYKILGYPQNILINLIKIPL